METLVLQRLAQLADVAGAHLESVPGGADTYLLEWIVHDWDDEHATIILRNCRRAMDPGGRVLLIEAIVPPGTANAAHAAKLQEDVLMMVLFGGRERTIEQFEALLDRAGLRLGRVVPLAQELSATPPLFVIEALSA